MNGFINAPNDLRESDTEQYAIDKCNENITHDPTSCLIILCFEGGEIKTIRIPFPAEGKISFREHNLGLDLLSFQAEDKQWIMTCSRPAHFLQDNRCVEYAVKLEDGRVYQIEALRQKYILYSEFIDDSSFVFHNYYVEENTEISVGCSKSCDIYYNNQYIASNQTLIQWDGRKWIVYDPNRQNSTFVNGRIVSYNSYAPGAMIEILGLRIILGLSFISVNDGNNRIEISTSRLRSFNHMDYFSAPEAERHTPCEKPFFNRLPRRREAMNIEPICIEAPPMSLNANRIPLLLRMGSPLVTSSASLIAGNITAMLSSVLFPVLTQKFTDKQRAEYEARRTEKYHDYLSLKQDEIQREVQREERIMNQNYPEFSQILSYAESGNRLWERRKNDDDFLTLRIGYGQLPMIASCQYPARSFEIDDDELLEEMYSLVEKPTYIQNAPILSAFRVESVCGVLGRRDLEIEFAKQLLMQIAILHSYDEVKIVVLINELELEQLEFIKFLPHLWSNQRDFRFLAVNAQDASLISDYLQKERGELIANSRDADEKTRNLPYYFIFAFDKRIFDSIEVLKDVIQLDRNIGISILTVFDDLPKECAKIFNLNDSGVHSVTYLKQIENPDDYFWMDQYDKTVALRAMKIISNTSLKMVSESYSLPKIISFLEMFNVGKIEDLNPLNRWSKNNPSKSLAAPVGVDTDGSIFELDLHEKYQGPHGLVAGMTGSGKSEFIITYILSMAVNYHPDEVAFILIDYKGGGLADAFEDKDRGVRLPHLVGSITNLDGSSIQRSLMSIQSELKRRQRIFKETKKIINEGTMDIYLYQKLYRERIVSKPLPHLFIISDEFAELKSQEPEFMDQLISAARIGRSLGIHLILATQKPAGVVNDQIWSNTRFRVCLKVQDRGDSIEMLKRPEAAELKDTGRFYLQIGYNEYFALGQSAWCGAPYIPQDTVFVQKDDAVYFLDSVGQTILRKKLPQQKHESGQKQVVAIVEYLSDIAKEIGQQPSFLWKEPLPRQIGVERLVSEYGIKRNVEIEIPIGLIDDPYHQMQYPLLLNLQKAKHTLVVGSSGSGKTTLLQTVLFGLAQNYSPEQVNFYVLDFSSRNLSVFKELPHCGAVLYEEHTGEIEKLVSVIEAIIEQRKTQFADLKVSSFDAYTQIEKIPLIVLVIDNLSAIDNMKKGRDLNERIANIMKNGASYGIKVIASITNLNDCILRMQHEFGNRIALQANDRYAYSNIMNIRCKFEPPQIAGRGICAVEGEGLELQVAIASEDEDEYKRSVDLQKKLDAIAKGFSGTIRALRIGSQRENESFEEFCMDFSPGRLPLGINLENSDRIAMPFQQMDCMSVYLGNEDGKSFVLTNLLVSARCAKMKILVVRQQESIFANYESVQKIGSIEDQVHYCCTVEDIARLNQDLLQMIIARTAVRKTICSNLGIGTDKESWTAPEAVRQWRKHLREKTEPVFVLIESMADFEVTLSPEQVGQFETIFRLCRGYNIYFCACHYAEDAERLKNAQKLPSSGNKEEQFEERPAEQVMAYETPEMTRAREIRHAVKTIKGCFNIEKFSLLFGGRYDCQDLVSLPYAYRTITSPSKPADYCRFLLHYRNQVVPMQMPHIEEKITAEDADELSII